MSTASIAMRANANSGAEQVCGATKGLVRPAQAVVQKLKSLYPEKTAANIACSAKVCSRTAEYWLSGKRDPSLDSFIALISSDDGWDILEAAMLAMPKAERPRWWVRQTNTARLAAIEVAQAEQEAEIRKLRLELTK